MSEEKSCWTCGHFLIGGGCYLEDTTAGFGKKVELDHVCDKWIEEGTKGTVTDFGDPTEKWKTLKVIEEGAK